MAFNLFPKPPAKVKPAEGKARPELSPRHDARAPASQAPTSAREIAAAVKNRSLAPVAPPSVTPATDARERDITLTGPHSMMGWTIGLQQSILVAEANPDLCTVLENAALLHGGGQTQAAREILEHGIANDDQAKASALAWLSLFDLLQREGDHVSFDRLALQYVVAFERSPPAWEEGGTRSRPGARPVTGGYVGFTGKLSAAHAPQISNLMAAAQKQPQLRLDLGSLSGADDPGAKLLAEALAKLRKRDYPLVLQHPEKLRRALDQSVTKGKIAGEGYWTLLLELLQWQHDQKAFDDRAIEFAIAFEVSPPSWEPPTNMELSAQPVDEAPAVSASEDSEMLVWSGTLTGSSDPQLAKLALFREGRHVVAINMSAVERIDFVCAGALLNSISNTESQRKTVQIMGASPIIRALLLLIGISPRHFIKKAQ
ncbi:MAG: STAS domain-containing protein [Betaproteobacteria bacterium]|nr:MAG: STAS domain-containing protein [Betaproteobacteria bacterium]